jgi:hypothetical protein
MVTVSAKGCAMIVEDFICLGRTVPEESKKYGHKVCMAGYSSELKQFLRVYPLPVSNTLKCNYRYCLGLSRNSMDSRRESWKLTDRVALYDSMEKESSSSIRDILSSSVSSSIAELNDARASLGVIKPDAITGEFELRKNCGTTQYELFETCDDLFGAKAVNAAPYLRFSAAGKSHRLQIREWGCYEWIRKNPGDCSTLWKNLKLDRDVYLLVGNMSNQRTTWLVIKSFSFERSSQRMLIEQD